MPPPYFRNKCFLLLENPPVNFGQIDLRRMQTVGIVRFDPCNDALRRPRMLPAERGNNVPTLRCRRIIAAQQMFQMIYSLVPISSNIAACEHLLVIIRRFRIIRTVDHRAFEQEKRHIERRIIRVVVN